MEDPSASADGGDGSTGTDTKSLLSDFYGAMMADEPAAPPETDDSDEQQQQQQQSADDDQQWDDGSSGSRSSAVSALPVAAAPRRPRVDEKLDLDSERFQPQLYVDSLLRSSSMKELLEADARLVAAKRSLDSDMQMLVYENYNKFISATDMIRQMKDNVDGMEGDMNRLITNMTTISNTTASIEQQLAPNRERVENLVGVSRLLKRLEFLFELPGRLTKSIEMGAYEQAVRYFRVSVNILSQYSHLKSFADIRRDSEQIIEQLKTQLKHNVATTDKQQQGGAAGGPAGSAGSTDQQLANTAMLIDLMEPAAPLMQAIFKPRTERLRAEMRKSVEMQALAIKRSASKALSAQQQQQQHNQQEGQKLAASSRKRGADKAESGRSGGRSGAADSSRKRASEQDGSSDSNNPFGEIEAKEDKGANNPFGEGDEDAAEDSAVAAAAVAENDETEEDEPSASAQRRLSSASVSAASGAAGRRASASSIGQLVDATADDDLIDSSTDLLQLLNAHFIAPFYVFTSSFHTIVLKPLEQQQSAAKKPNKAKQDSLATCQQALNSFTAALLDEYIAIVKKELARRAHLINSHAAAGPAHGSTSQLVAAFTTQLSTLHTSLDRLVPLLPSMQLVQRVQDLEELAIRSCLDSITELTQHQIIQLLVKLHNDALEFDAKEYVRTLLKQNHLSPQELHQAYAAQSDTAGVSEQSDLPAPAAIATAIRARLEECVQLMQPLLNTSAYLPHSTLGQHSLPNTTTHHIVTPHPNATRIAIPVVHQPMLHLINRWRLTLNADLTVLVATLCSSDGARTHTLPAGQFTSLHTHCSTTLVSSRLMPLLCGLIMLLPLLLKMLSLLLLLLCTVVLCSCL